MALEEVQDIFSGLTKFPSPNYPGSLIVTGDAKPLMSYPNAGDTIFAAASYGSGRICVFAHDCYLDENWIAGSDLRKQFMSNLENWLTCKRIRGDSDIGSLSEISASGDLNRYKLLQWHHGANVDAELQQNILNFVENGGGLICASTPWGYCQIHRVEHLDNMSLFHFLKNNFGILFATNTLDVPDEIDLEMNMARHAHFHDAIGKLNHSQVLIEQICSTLAAGLQDLHREGFITDADVDRIHAAASTFCCSANVPLFPSSQQKICDPKMKQLCCLLGSCFQFKTNFVSPGADKFPGTFEQLPPLQNNIKLTFHARFKERLSTGYYLPAGVSMDLEIQGRDLHQWNLLIGAHTDDLSQCDKYSRWPRVTIRKVLEPRMSVSSPFGGLVYFESPKDGSITIILNNVVAAPVFDLTKPETIQNWHQLRSAPGLWAELAGEHIIFTTPSKCVRNLDNPTDVLKFWDSVVQSHHECRGTRASDYRRERVVNDVQPCAGYMHAGYPIVTHLDCCESAYDECIFDLAKLKKNGCWGLFHELGHNMQRSEWTFEGCGEVTVNIFSTHATTFVIGQDIIKQKWPLERKPSFVKFFAKQPTYDDWSNNCEMALMTFVQLIKHFGWDSMRKFMRDYEADMANNRAILPRTNQDKIDQWVIRYSKIVGRNIKPQFEMWGLPVSGSVVQHVGHFPSFCPLEEKNAEKFFAALN